MAGSSSLPLLISIWLQLQYSINITQYFTSLTAALAALYEISIKSAPLNPSVNDAKKFRSTSGAIGVFLRFAFNILTLDGKSGKGI